MSAWQAFMKVGPDGQFILPNADCRYSAFRVVTVNGRRMIFQGEGKKRGEATAAVVEAIRAAYRAEADDARP